MLPCGVARTRFFIKYWLPVLFWMGLIFTASSDRFSFQRSSRVIAPLTRWLFPRLSEEQVHEVVVAVRKGAHVTEYAILSALVWRLIRQRTPGPRPWRWAEAAWALVIALAYAAGDEFHQRFVPTREGSVRDVAIDGIGAGLALLLVWILGRWRKRW